MASAQVIVAAFALSFASVASGMLIGYSLRDKPTLAMTSTSPPIELGVSVDAPTLVLRSVRRGTPPVLLKPPRVVLHRALTFFDFKRAACDEAESVRGSVLRCSYARADRR